MNKTSLKQQILLVLFGVLLSLLILEVSLRLAGAVVSYLQEKHNHLLFNPNEYRILCLGESTTALGGEDSYPSQLEMMLNAHESTHKYTVVNKGVISTTSNIILSLLDENLDKYRPQMVIVMMGINDRAYLHDFSKSLWLENIKAYFKEFRVYKLGHLINERFRHHSRVVNVDSKDEDVARSDESIQQTEDFLKMVLAQCLERFGRHMQANAQYLHNNQLAQAHQEALLAKESLKEAGSACVELARRYRFEGLYPQEQKALGQALNFSPDSPDAYQELGEFYLAQNKVAQSIKAFQAALSLDYSNTDILLGLAHAYYQAHDDKAFFAYAKYLQLMPKDYWGHIEMARWLKAKMHHDQAETYLQAAIDISPNFADAYVDLGQLFDEDGRYAQEESLYLKGIVMGAHGPRLYQALAQYYQRQGKKELADSYFQKIANQQMPEYCPATLVNYRLLLDKLLKRHIKVVVMQYPLRDINILKDYLGQKDGVIFVENKQNFKQAMAKDGYNRYFKDNFAFDFGHCTREGNALIARNLLHVILYGEVPKGQAF